MSKTPSTSFLLHNASEIVTLAPLAAARRTTRITDADLGKLGKGAWIQVKNGKIASFGTGPEPSQAAGLPRVDAQGGYVMPGLVDSHAHPIFAGQRSDEFVMRLGGATYQQIAAAGGGIVSSMKRTRGASDEQHLELLAKRFRRFLELGITTLEAKSGYGLSVDTELKLLRLLDTARKQTPQHVAVTCLALHAKSPEHASTKEYSLACAEELLPIVAQEKLAEAADAFIEAGYFSVDDVEPYARKAIDLGLKIRVHADEFSDAGAAIAAARWRATSADHLQYASDEGVRAMAEAGVTATILPGTSLYTKIPFASGRRFADAGCPVAVATDYNPGSCVIDNLAMLATVAAIHCGLKPAEALAGVTYVPAVSLGLAGRKGALAPGHDADLLVYDLEGANAWIADFGRVQPRQVWIEGQQVK